MTEPTPLSRNDESKPIPRWTTAWPDWYGIHGNVDVVPAQDYDALAALVRECVEGTTRDCTAWNDDARKLLAGTPIAEVSDEEIEKLIDGSDGHWREDVFRIDGPALTALLRKAVSMSRTLVVSEKQTSPWIPVTERLPDAGVQVLAKRGYGTWDRAECNPIYFDGLPAWYLPEGPTPCASWEKGGVTHWMEVPE